MSTLREVKEGIIYQGTDEEIAYVIDASDYGSGTPSSVTQVKAYDENDNDTDVTTTLFPTNSPSIAGSDITLSPLKDPTIDHSYRIEILFTDSASNIWEPYFIVKGVKY